MPPDLGVAKRYPGRLMPEHQSHRYPIREFDIPLPDILAVACPASEEYHRSGVAVPVEAVLDRLQFKLDAKRKKLGR